MVVEDFGKILGRADLKVNFPNKNFDEFLRLQTNLLTLILLWSCCSIYVEETLIRATKKRSMNE